MQKFAILTLLSLLSSIGAHAGKPGEPKKQPFSLDVPKGWVVSFKKHKKTDPRFAKEDGEQTWTYAVKNGKGVQVFDITIVKGGPEFISCWCAPKKDYKFAKVGNFKTWGLVLEGTRTLKIAGKKLRLDVHASFDKQNEKVINKLVDSIKLVE